MTVFAPTDTAFNSLPAAVMAEILGSPGLLQKVLMGHIVDHDVTTLDMANNETVVTLAGTTPTFTIEVE